MKFKLCDKRLILIVSATVCVGFLFMWSIAAGLDKEAKSALMSQATIVANSINNDRLLKLSADKTDILLADYSRIKQQLYNVRTTNETCRFLYILGYDPDKDNVFFFIDSQLETSEDYAPPGLIYDEVTDEFKDAVSAGQKAFIGPVTDSIFSHNKVLQ